MGRRAEQQQVANLTACRLEAERAEKSSGPIGSETNFKFDRPERLKAAPPRAPTIVLAARWAWPLQGPIAQRRRRRARAEAPLATC